MGIKYKIEYSNRKDDDFKIEIDVPNYEGEVIEYRGYGGSPLEISHSGGQDNPFDEHVISSQASISFILPPEHNIEDLQLAGDLEVKVKVYKNFDLFWSGFLISDGLQEVFTGSNAPITVMASDGLKQFDGMDFPRGFAYSISMPDYEANTLCPMRYIQLMLRRLDNELTTVWNCDIKNLQDTTKDFLAGVTELDPTGELIDNHDFTCDKLLEGILRSANLTIQQVEGKWYIQDRQLTHKDNGVLNGYFLDSGSAIEYTEDLNVEPTEIYDDTIKMIKKAVSKVEVTYKNTRNENVLPNGSFNLLSGGYPAFWSKTNGEIESGDAINGRPIDQYNNVGRSMKFTTNAGGNGEFFLRSNSIAPFMNYDAHTLFPRFTIGFKFMPENYPQRNVNGVNVINWDLMPLMLEVCYTAERDGQTDDYYLNENGFWVRDVRAGVLKITNTEYDNTLRRFRIKISGGATAGQSIELVEYIEDTPNYVRYSNLDFTTNLLNEQAVITYLAQDPSIVQVDGNTFDWFLDQTDRYYRDPLVYINNSPGLTTTNRIQIMVDKMITGDVADIQFTSKGSQGRITIPDPGELVGVNDLGRGRLRFKFIQKIANSICYFDDVYINVDDNNDKYILKLPALKDSKEDYELNISSSFSGFLLSSYMNDFSNSDANMLFVKNGIQATLTEHYGRDVLHWRSKPCRVFDFSADGYVRPIDYITFYGQKFVPLSTSYNTETDITKITMIEIKHEDIEGAQVAHEASNKDNIR